MMLQELNALAEADARNELQRCCGSSEWVNGMTQCRPFHSAEEMLRTAENLWRNLPSPAWKEAFSHHPKIGDRESLQARFSSTARWAAAEQAGTGSASEDVLALLAHYNRLYEEKFGYIFIICATGKSAEEMLQAIRMRLDHDPETELNIAAREQENITRLRLQKLLNIQP